MQPQPVFHFSSSPEHYVCDAAVLCCFDHRFHLVTSKFLKRQGIARPDMIVLAGGPKSLASPQSEAERDFVLQQLQISTRLHSTSRVLLLSHADCGAYGGLAAFAGNSAREGEHHRLELRRAASVVKSHFPHHSVDCFFLSFDGVFSVDSAPASAAQSRTA
jgi:carbonic anhydrase